MKTRICMSLLASLALLSGPATGQAVEEPRRQPNPLVHVEDLAVHKYAPNSPDVYELFKAIRLFYGRKLMVESGKNSLPRMVDNMTVFGDQLIVYDEPEQVERIIEALGQLDTPSKVESAQPQSKPGDRFEVLQYSPRFVGLQTLQSALSPFARQLFLNDEEGHDYYLNNVSVVPELASVIVRDTPAHLAQIREVLENLDRPAAQVLLSAQLVEASKVPTGNAVPAELGDALSRLVGYEHFAVVATSSVRSSVGPGVRLQLLLSTDHAKYSLDISSSAYDPKTRSLTIEECSLKRLATTDPNESRLFYTSCVVAANETTVLGSSGSTPLFAVLRITPVNDSKSTR